MEGFDMSVVVNVCDSNFTMMVSDNRLVKIDMAGNIEPVSDHFKKIFRINENILIGFVGDALQCQNTMHEICKYNLRELTLDRIKDIVKEFLEKQKNEINKLGVRVILSGRQSNGKFITYAYDSSDNFSEVIYDPGDKMCLVYGVPKGLDKFCNYGEIIDSAIRDNKFNSTSELVKIIGNAIYEISKLNPVVNNVISYEVIS